MKKGIHPKNHQINVTCACGNSFDTLSTSNELKVEVCSSCHPFFTGTQRFVDTAGRVERFNAKLKATQKRAEAEKAKREKKANKAAEKAQETQTE